MPRSLADPPVTTDLINLPEIRSKADPLARLPGAVTIQRAWYEYFLGLTTRTEQSSPVLLTTALTLQTGAIAPTDLPLGTTVGGLYRVSTYMRITTAASTSSSLTITIGFTDGSVNCIFAGAALTTNTTASVQCNTFVLRADPASPITYRTAYASVGATAMRYALSVVVEQVGA